MAPRRLYHLLLDYVLGFMVARQVSVQDVRGLPPDITHDLLHRLLSAASSVATKDQAEERAKRLDDQLLALLVSPHLTQLRLRLCVRVTDASFQHLFTPSHSPQGIPEFALQEVSLDSCWGVTDASLHRIAKHCPSLTKLELIGSPRFTAAAFDWSSLTSLQVLRVKACKGISDRAFDNLKDSPSTSLRVLSISGTENTDGNNFLAQLAQMCPNLEQLELVRPFSAPARVPVLQAGQFPHLRALSLGSDGGPMFARADERFVEALLDQLPHLVALRCSSIFDVGRLTNEDAARRLEVLITAARQGDMVPRIRPALQRSSSTLRVVCLPMVTGATTTSYPSWGASVPPPSQDEVYSLLQLLAQGLPGLRFLQFPSSDVEHLKKYLDYAQQSEHQQELHTLQIMAMNGLHKLSAEGVEELIIRRMPLSVLDLRCYFGSPPVHGIYDKLHAKYPQLIGPRPLGAWAEFATLSDFGYHIC